jgi:hypothetical protein
MSLHPDLLNLVDQYKLILGDRGCRASGIIALNKIMTAPESVSINVQLFVTDNTTGEQTVVPVSATTSQIQAMIQDDLVPYTDQALQAACELILANIGEVIAEGMYDEAIELLKALRNANSALNPEPAQ